MTLKSPADAKTMLRLALREQRRALSKATPDAGEQAAALLPAELLAAKVVAGYWPQPVEIDPTSLMRRFAEAGVRLALPVAPNRDTPLAFRAWFPGDPLTPDAHGISAPTSAAPLVRPDFVIVPLLAFDRTGGRMGQGGGHYDRTLAALRAQGQVFALGLAFAGQEIAGLPTEPHDQKLDAILTEKAYIEVS